MLMKIKNTLIITCLFFGLAACNNHNDDAKAHSKQGLPDAQKAQGDNAAGVKFGQQETFKSLSDDVEKRP